MVRRALVVAALLALAAGAILAQERERERRLAEDRAIAEKNGWIADDLVRGVEEAKESGKPLLVSIRCPP